MHKQRFAFIWSLYEAAEVPVWIHYRVRLEGRCRIFQLERVENPAP